MNGLTLTLLSSVGIVFVQIGPVRACEIGASSGAFVFAFFTYDFFVLVSHISQVVKAPAVPIDLEVVASLANAFLIHKLEVLIAAKVFIWSAAWTGSTL